MGAFGSTAAIGFALGPFAGPSLAARTGRTQPGYFFAAVSVAAAATGVIAVRAAQARRGGAALPSVGA